MKTKDTFCNYCGNIFNPNQAYPKVCLGCDNIIYNNPLPVTAAAIMVRDSENSKTGVLVVKRNINPKKGQWALPGGFLEQGETWQEGTAREVLEETGLDLKPENFHLESVETASNGNLILFSDYYGLYLSDINNISNDEVSEIKVIFEPEELAFPTHTLIMKKLLESYNDI